MSTRNGKKAWCGEILMEYLFAKSEAMLLLPSALVWQHKGVICLVFLFLSHPMPSMWLCDPKMVEEASESICI